MRVKRYRVLLAEEEQELRPLVLRGRATAYKQTPARILLIRDENQAGGAMKEEEIARGSWAAGVAPRPVWRSLPAQQAASRSCAPPG